MTQNPEFELSASLRHWYKKNARALPWRETQDAYRIWLSEIILQQTRVQQGLPYFEKFRNLFPDIVSFADAPEDDILKVWQGLGYYSRARNMLRTAKMIVEQYEGHFPESFEELKKLPGIGDYTAAAIASFAFNIPVAVVDGNVKRVISRLFAENFNSRDLKSIANQLLNPEYAADHNQAMMELGAMVCTPQNPDCSNCPWFDKCLSGSTGRWKQFPAKVEKTKPKERYFHYWVPVFNGHTFLRQRGAGDIWQGLYEFPLIETSRVNEEVGFYKNRFPDENFIGTTSGTFLGTRHFKHVLSHQIIHATFHLWEYSEPLIANSDTQIVAIDEIHIKFACSRLTEKYLQSREFLDYVSQ